MKSAKLLIVEDDYALREFMATLLGPHVGEIRAVASGEEALRVAREWVPDLAVVDLKMPGIGGVAAIEGMRADPRLDQLIILVVTGHKDLLPFERCRELRVGGFFGKPIDRDFPDLASAIYSSWRGTMAPGEGEDP